MSTKKPRLGEGEYTVAWISALPIEHAAAVALLDEEHEPPDRRDTGDAIYTLGVIHGHNIVIACLPAGHTGIAPAANLAARLNAPFTNVTFGLLVGIGGGCPSGDADIRLGDVVVSQPRDGHGGVVQYDMVRRLPDSKVQHTSHMDKPSKYMLSALTMLQSKHHRGEGSFASYLSKLEETPKFGRDAAGPDRLFRAKYQHMMGSSCAECDERELVEREPRPPHDPIRLHYGTIASANSLIRDAAERDRLCADLGGNILCFEMEAAGLLNSFPCLVFRGICDYADSHKNKKWQPYASATAAAVAKDYLSVIRPTSIAKVPLNNGAMPPDSIIVSTGINTNQLSINSPVASAIQQKPPIHWPE